jgi:hypothetical protein
MRKKNNKNSINIVLYDRLTPRLMRTCQTNLVQLCKLPKDWTMNEEMSDIQVGMYLGCLYQQRQQV